MANQAYTTKGLMKKVYLLVLLVFICSSSEAVVNVRLSPLAPLVGGLSGGVDLAVSGSWTLGPEGSFLSTESGGYDVRAYSFGIRGNYWLNGKVFTQGWYFGPGAHFIGATVEDNTIDPELTGDAHGVAFSGIFGYQWMWERFNISLGAGPNYTAIDKIVVENSEGRRETYKGLHGIGIALEFNLGWKF